jgi:hypothetical protein
MKNNGTKTLKTRVQYAIMKPRRITNAKASPETQALQVRRLKFDERVVSGDYIANENGGFELWEGPGGFRADAFLKPIYRRKREAGRY